jgi:hypothetical protein
MSAKIREGHLLGSGDVVCPYCERVVPDSAETDETIQLTLLGGVVTRAYFECPCGRRFIIVIVESEEC